MTTIVLVKYIGSDTMRGLASRIITWKKHAEHIRVSSDDICTIDKYTTVKVEGNNITITPLGDICIRLKAVTPKAATDFQSAVNTIIQREIENPKMSIDHLLINPVQRIMRYPMILMDLVKFFSKKNDANSKLLLEHFNTAYKIAADKAAAANASH